MKQNNYNDPEKELMAEVMAFLIIAFFMALLAGVYYLVFHVI